MGKASSSKKVARLAQKGKGRKVRFQGGTLFPALVIGVALVGAGLIIYSRESIPNLNTPPTVEDHWHASYGFYGCDAWLPDLVGNKEEQSADGQLVSTEFKRTGIHSHEDGVMHWHPFSSESTGRNAKLGVFLNVYGVKLSNSKLVFPADQGSAVYEEGKTKCTDKDGKSVDGELVVYAFNAYNTPKDFTTYITNFTDVRIKQDGMAFAIVFAPAGENPGLPPSAVALPELGAKDGGATGQTSTTIAGATTVPGATTIAGASTVPDVTAVPSTATTSTVVDTSEPTTTAG
ncbi:MAG: hypothetical protein WCG40_03130 [Actinomycetes bacterium]